MRTLFVALVCALGVGSAGAQLLQPPPQRPDALMSGVTSAVIAMLKQDLAAGRPTDVAQQAALVAEFRTLLVRAYSTALSTYRDQEIEYRSALRAAVGDTDVQVGSFVRRSGRAPHDRLRHGERPGGRECRGGREARAGADPPAERAALAKRLDQRLSRLIR
jgi:hypothetical protein